MPHDPILHGVCAVIAEVLDLDEQSLSAETYVFRDLDTESIDLLEYGIGIGRHFGIRLQDSTAFLKDLRVHLAHANAQPIASEDETESIIRRVAHLRAAYPHLSAKRLTAIVGELGADNRPVLRISDIADYVRHALPPQQQPAA